MARILSPSFRNSPNAKVIFSAPSWCLVSKSVGRAKPQCPYLDPRIANAHNHVLGPCCYYLGIAWRQNGFWVLRIPWDDRAEPALYVSCCWPFNIWNYLLVAANLRSPSFFRPAFLEPFNLYFSFIKVKMWWFT